MTKLLRDPLVHFLVLGAVMFAALAWLDESDEPARERIVIAADQIEQARITATARYGREPTLEELQELLEPVIREQVLYREARALGLDRDDETVRLRLVEKMRFLAEDLVEPESPTQEALEDYFAAQPDRFFIPARVTFEQVYFSPTERGEQVEADAVEALARLGRGEAGDAGFGGFGDRSPLQARYEAAARERVELLFGEPLAEALFALEAGQWTGPFRSDFGLHVVRLIEREEPRQPELEDVYDTVLETYLADRRRDANEAEYQRMRERYEIVIDAGAAVPSF